jgi:hypothetical protein
VVERYNVCPFAAPSLRGGHVSRQAVLEADEAAAGAAARARIAALGEDEAIEVALLIFPRLPLAPAAFERFCAPLRAAHAAFVAAVFHPEASYDAATAAQAVGFFRRAPDPTLQLVRASVLEQVRGPDGKFLFDFSAAAWAELRRREHKLPTSDRIARDNHALLLSTRAELEAIYSDLRADRERSYARAGGCRSSPP